MFHVDIAPYVIVQLTILGHVWRFSIHLS